MPTIVVLKSDFAELLGAPVELGALERELELAKAELKGYDPVSDEIKIELNDTNRPDLWSPEGLARQLRLARGNAARGYGFTRPGASAAGTIPEIHVDPALRDIRPFVAGFLASGAPLTDAGLRNLIQSQEKLAENFGQRRRAVAIGVYRAQRIRFPIHYRAADPDTTRYAPLGLAAPLTLHAILDTHPKGQEYGHLLRGAPRFPLLVDDGGEVLSMPPIVNSQSLGAVEVGDADLFVEVTGTDLRSLLLALNIAACDLADRGAAIRPVAVVYPYDTPFGRRVVTPADFVEPVAVTLAHLAQLLGEAIPGPEVASHLARIGHRDVHATTGGDAPAVTATPPPYRDDILHPVDLIEDVAIARGYDSFAPVLPEEFTVGRLSAAETLARQLTDLLVGAGYQQVVSNILTAREILVERMNRVDGGANLVEIENVMSANYAVLRDAILPSLLEVEAASSKALYPHRMFEIGECATIDPATILGTRTRLLAGALLAHPSATFSELHSTLDAILFYLGHEAALAPAEHASCIPGRAGRILLAGQDAGWIGELAPACLERWGIGVPASAFELDLAVLLALANPAGALAARP
jgi:phenylalanyl-tRNA synthetase beta chain